MKFAMLTWLCFALNLNAAESNLFSQEDLVLQIRRNVIARTNGGSTQLFAKYLDGTKFVRNPKFWLKDMNGLTGVHAGGGPGATAITPWHVVGANHWKNEAGSKLYFCDLQNHTIVRTVVAGAEIRPDIKSDIWLAVLDEALPGSIVPMPLMPADWTNHVVLSRFPVAALNKNSDFGSAEILSFRQQVSGWFLYGYLYNRSSLAPTLQFTALKGGDSGRPIVTWVNEDLVLLGHLTFEPGDERFAGPDYSLYSADIQAAIRNLGTNDLAKAQNIRTIGLSGFK